MSTLTESDKDFIRSYVAEALTEDERKKRRRECVNQFNVPLSQISAITAWTTIWQSKGQEIKKVEVKEVEGCHADYDNPVKQAWRRKWQDFLAKNIPQCNREKMRVLCLPGKRCLEIPLYLELGFNPQNITGVEGGDEEARNTFLNNAYKYKINPKVGRLENLLRKERGVYDVVSLDFTGPLSKTCLDIIKDMPFAPQGDSNVNTKSYFMLNVLGKREQHDSQGIVDFYASLTRPELQDLFHAKMGMEDFKEVYNYVNDLQMKLEDGQKIYESLDLKEKRDKSLPFIVAGLLGKDRRFHDSRWGYYRKEIPERIKEEGISKFGTAVLATLASELRNHLGSKAVDALFIGVPQLIDIVTNYRPFVQDLEEYLYWSPVNNRNSPFLTEMLTLMTPMGDYVKCRYFLRFIVDAIFWKAEHDEPIYVEIRNRYGNAKTYLENMERKDSIAFVNNTGQTISSCSWNKIIEAYDLIIKNIDNDMTTKLLSGAQNCRELI